MQTEHTDPAPPTDALATFMECLIPALLASLPYFLEALVKCLSGGGGSGTYNPGNRNRGCP